jgi:hypothetical protein
MTHLCFLHLLWVLRQQVQRPGERTACGLVASHQHGQQIVTQLRAVNLLSSSDQEAQHTWITW